MSARRHWVSDIAVGGSLGFLIGRVVAGEAELITLNAFTPWGGVGTALVEALARLACVAGLARLRVTTTNDNVDALRFYQRRGFALDALRPGAMDAARRMKPTIPLTGRHGIALRDEIELVRALAPLANPGDRG